MIECVRFGKEQHKRRLSEIEGPVALQTSVLANINRDSKRRKEPYKPSDYSLYTFKEDLNIARGEYGAAALKLINEGRFPNWALFCYKDLVGDARKGYVPELAAYITDDAIVLHPVVTPSGVKGLLIAMESASMKVRAFKSENGEEIRLFVPEIPTKVVASEDVTLRLVSNQYPLS